jgi:hypothetical protein
VADTARSGCKARCEPPSNTQAQPLPLSEKVARVGLIEKIRSQCFQILEEGVQNESVIALTRKNALFAGHDLGAENWAIAASLIETCKLHSVDPLAWMTDALTKLVNLWPASRIDI